MTSMYIGPLTNWGPIADLVMEPQGSPNDPQRTAKRKGIFAAVGRQPYGGVAELRHGIEARIGTTLEDDTLSGAIRMWPMHDKSQKGLFFLISFPNRTQVLRLYTDGTEPEYLEEGACSALDLDHETIVLERLGDGSVLQITDSAVCLAQPTVSEQPFHELYKHTCMPEQKILAAAADVKSHVFATAVRTHAQVVLSVMSMADSGNLKVTGTIVLEDDPSCMAIHALRNCVYVFVGTAKGLLKLIYQADDGSLNHVSSYNLGGTEFDAVRHACESIAVLHNATASILNRAYRVLCGLRNGKLHVLEMFVRSDTGR